MPNYIERAQAYVPMLDEVYKLASCTSDMTVRMSWSEKEQTLES